MRLPRWSSSNGAFVKCMLLGQEPRIQHQPDTNHSHHKIAPWPPAPSSVRFYCVEAAIHFVSQPEASRSHLLCCAEPLSFVGGGRVLLVAALIAATASFSLDGAGGKGRPFAKASRSMLLQISCAPTSSSERALSRSCTEAARWPMAVGLQELMPAGGMRGSARVAHLAGGATRPPQRLRAAARPFPNAGFFVGGAITQPLFLARPAGTPSSAHRGRTRPLPPPGEPPNARAAPGGTASMAPRSASAGRGRPYRLWETVLLGRTAGWGLGGWYVRAKWGRFGGESYVKNLCAGG